MPKNRKGSVSGVSEQHILVFLHTNCESRELRGNILKIDLVLTMTATIERGLTLWPTGVLHTLLLVFLAALKGGSYYSHFTGRETEVQ